MNLNELKEYCKHNITTRVIKNGDNVSECIFMCKNGSKIHIKKKNRGKFTESAKKHNMGVQQFASKVLSNKDKYSSTLVKRANFAKNSSKWKHKK